MRPEERKKRRRKMQRRGKMGRRRMWTKMRRTKRAIIRVR